MSDTAPPKTTVSISVDGRPHDAAPGQLVIDACEDAGTYVPRFCYHPRMTPVGMCRQCLVEVEGPRGPMMVVSCMTPVAEGQVVRTDTPAVKKAQEGVLEFLLANHPLDCPVCDKGGECPLQDQAFSHGPGESRFVEEKRHYEKPIPISDLVLLDRERCILCDRCTRFAKEVAGDPLIHFTHRGNTTQVQTFPDEPFASYFSGNTVQICPVGALTAKPYRFKARPWDLDQVESTCTTCAVGCRIVVQSSRNELLRYQGVDSDPVNWGWLCDKGRFAFQAVNADDRVRTPMVRKGEGLVESTWSAALDAAATALKATMDPSGSGPVAILGGARGTNEDAFAWARLARIVLRSGNTDAQLADGLPAEVLLGLPAATLDEAASATTILLLGPDLKEELPVAYLRLRDAAEKRRSRIIEVSPVASGLTSYAYRSVRNRPGEQAAAVRAVITEERAQFDAGPVVVVVGRQNLAEHVDATLAAIAAVQEMLPQATFLAAARRGNVMGALLAGLAPQPGAMDAKAILEAAAAGKVGCLVLLGADPVTDCPDKELARRAIAGARYVVAVDTFLTDSSRQADVVLPAAAFAEKAGTTTNLEGRVTALQQKVTPVGQARADWMIAVELAARLGADLGIDSTEQATALLAEEVPAFAGVTADALRAARDGVLVARDAPVRVTTVAPDVPSQGGYEFRLVVSRKLYDAGVAVQHSPDLVGLAPGARLHLHPLDAERYPGTVKVSTSRAAVALAVDADPGVPRGVAWVAYNQPDAAVGELLQLTASVTDVRVESLP
jgi:NADH-quinone oxidoreductase subunit G